MANNDIQYMLDHLKRIKSGGDLSFKIDQIENLEMELRFWRTLIKYHHALLPSSSVNITKKAHLLEKMLQSVYDGNTVECKISQNVDRLVSQLLEFAEVTSSKYNCELSGSYLLEYLDLLDKNLDDAPVYLVRSDPFLMKGIKILQKTDRFLKQMKVIQKKMRFLGYLYATEINGYADQEMLEGLETRIQFLADNVREFCFAMWTKDEDAADDILSKPPHLLCLIVLVQREMQKIFLGELKASKFSQSKTFKDQKLPKGFSHHLHRLLMFLKNKMLKNFPSYVFAQSIDAAIEFLLLFLADVPNHVLNGKMLHKLLEKVEDLVCDVQYVIVKLLPSSTSKEDSSKIKICSIQILEKAENLQTQVEMNYRSLKFTPSQFPTVGGLSFLDSLQQKLNEMLKSESGLDFTMKHHIGILETELSSLTSVFRDVSKMPHEHEVLKDFQKRTINLAYEAEVAIDSILVQYNALWHLFCSLPTIINEIKQISAEVTARLFEHLALKPISVVEPSKHLPIQHSYPMKDEEIVGFENDLKIITQHLTGGKNELDVIPIVGMGGQGKTTCARKLYQNDNIVSHFDVRAWCVISQTYNRKELLHEILSQVTGSKNMVEEENVLADMLRKRLIGKRYLIVLDDMWDGKAWDDLRFSFPECKKGCRIIVTTRLEEVGKQVKHHTDPYFLPFLTTKESCELLQKKVFQQEGFPHELHDVSLAVAERCKGLPLVVALVAGILRKKKMEVSWWHEVENALFSYLAKSDQDYSMATMQLSYDNLPDHIRPCLLYMGMFPEDHRISVRELINLWIAEGFVESVESVRLEEEAEGYLIDLISRNLVMVSQRRYNGKVEHCQLHDIVLHFCLEKGREEKFMSVVKGHYSQFEPLKWKGNRVSLHLHYTDEELPGFPLLGCKQQEPLHQHLRSVLSCGSPMRTISNAYHDISKLRLLKVLDQRIFYVHCISSSLLHPLIHLKYLSLYTMRLDLKPEFYLRHLETLIVDVDGSGPVVHLPATFWKMEKLRYVYIWKHTCYQGLFEESSKLENLRFLSCVEFSLNDADCVDVLSRRCPNLQELQICFDEVADAPENCTYNLNFEDFTQLQVIDITIKGQITEFRLPLSLKELTLEMYHITRKVVSMIAELPSLEYLRIEYSKFEEEEWCLGDVTFHKLKYLGFCELDISRWDASEESFPLLETLVIVKNNNNKVDFLV